MEFTQCRGRYASKPSKSVIRALRSCSSNGAANLSVSDFAEYISQGRAFHPSIFDLGAAKTIQRDIFQFTEIIGISTAPVVRIGRTTHFIWVDFVALNLFPTLETYTGGIKGGLAIRLDDIMFYLRDNPHKNAYQTSWLSLLNLVLHL